MLIDCETCELRDIACGGCVVSTLLGGHGPGFEIDESERRALDVLADVGLVPPLRHTAAGPGTASAAGSAATGGAPGRRVS